MDKRFALVAGTLTALVHLGAASQYGYYRDELYFIACAKRLAWGYVDMPPLAPLVAWLCTPVHYELVALRVLVALAAGATVYLASAITAEFGGSRTAQRFAALTVALTPAYLFLGGTLTTTSFEPFTWALVVYATIRLARSRELIWWYVLVAAIAFGLYGKYSIALLAVALIAGLLGTAERKILKGAAFPIAAIAAGALLTPNIIWQRAHDWPIFAVLHGDVAGRHPFNSGVQFEFANSAINAIAFYVEQVVFFNPVAAPVWLIGAFTLLRNRDFLRFRFIGIAFVFLLVIAAVLNAKGYYIAGIYTPLFCAGWVAIERWTGKIVQLSVIPALAATLIFTPFTLAVLPPATFIAYSKAFGIPQPLFADEFGWDAMARRVAYFYLRIPAPQRSQTAVFADTYGDAAALEFYGPRYGLPQPISAQNNYYLWGPGPYDGRSVLAVGASQADLLRASFGRVSLLGTFFDPNRAAAEGPTPIFLCTQPRAPLPQLWPRFKWYGA